MKAKDYAGVVAQKLNDLLKNKPFVLFIWFGLSLFPVIREVLQPKGGYHDWYPDLVAKNAENIASNRTYICVMGMIS